MPRSTAARLRHPPARASAARTNPISNRRRASSRVKPVVAVSRQRSRQRRGADRAASRCAEPRWRRARSAVRARCLASRSAPGRQARRRPARLRCRRGPPRERQKWRASSVMSSGRLRSGGTSIRITSRRNRRSARNLRRRHLVGQRPVGGCDDPGVHATRTRLTQPSNLAVLQRAQQLGLRTRAQLAHLVQEQGAAVGVLEKAGALGHRAGERTTRVAEQLRFDEVVGQRGAIERAEPSRVPRAPRVNSAGDEFLPGAALSLDQHRERRRAGAVDGTADASDAVAGANQRQLIARGGGPLPVTRHRHYGRKRGDGRSSERHGVGGRRRSPAAREGADDRLTVTNWPRRLPAVVTPFGAERRRQANHARCHDG